MIERRDAIFKPGKVVITAALRDELWEAIPTSFEGELTYFLTCHLRGDWGDVDAEDWASNDRAVEGFLDLELVRSEETGGQRVYDRVLSSYRLSNGTRLWIITEADRSSTTLLRPEDY